MSARLAIPRAGSAAPLWADHFAPPDARRGGLVVIHDLSGVTPRLLDVAAGFAEDGYETLCPALFDAREPDDPGVSATPPSEVVAVDLQAVIDVLAPPVFVVGHGWGGTAAWLAAARCSGLAAVSCYDGEAIGALIDAAPRVPIILHFGRAESLPPTAATIAAAYPDMAIHLYDAAGGFGADRPEAASRDAARLARLRTLRLFTLAGGGRGEL